MLCRRVRGEKDDALGFLYKGMLPLSLKREEEAEFVLMLESDPPGEQPSRVESGSRLADPTSGTVVGRLRRPKPRSRVSPVSNEGDGTSITVASWEGDVHAVGLGTEGRRHDELECGERRRRAGVALSGDGTASVECRRCRNGGVPWCCPAARRVGTSGVAMHGDGT